MLSFLAALATFIIMAIVNDGEPLKNYINAFEDMQEEDK